MIKRPRRLRLTGRYRLLLSSCLLTTGVDRANDGTHDCGP